MKIEKEFLKLILTLSILFCVGITPIVFADGVCAASKNYEYQVLDLVNEERSKVGVAPLKMDKKLFNAAEIRVKEIKVKFSHIRPDGSNFNTVSSKATGENIAWGQKTPKDVMNTWMNSKGHRNNILNPKFKSIGIRCLGGNSKYWVQLFGNKKADERLESNPIGNDKNTIKKPSTPSVSLVSANKMIIVKWKKVSNASGYQIYSSKNKNGKYTLKKTITKGNIVQYTDKNLKKKKYYYYKIRSYININGNKVYSTFSPIKSKIPK